MQTLVHHLLIAVMLCCQAIASSLAKKGGFSAGVVAAQYKYKKSTVDVKVDTESSVHVLYLVAFSFPCASILIELLIS